MHEPAEGQSKCFSAMRENYATSWKPDRRDKVSPSLSELGDVFKLWGENAVGRDDRLQRGEKKENVSSHVRAEQTESGVNKLTSVGGKRSCDWSER